MALFKRKKKNEPEDVVTPSMLEDESSPADYSNEDFDNYINRRRDAPSDEDGDPAPASLSADEADEDSDVPPEDDQAEPEKEETTPPFKSFGTEDEYNSEVQKAIDAARKQWDLDNEAVKARYDRMDKLARAYFPDAGDDAFDSLSSDLESQYEERSGTSYGDYLKNLERDESAAKWDAQEKAKTDHAANKQAILDKWIADAGNLMVIVPDFSLEEAFKKKEFADVLINGGDVFSAYAMAYKGDPDPEPEPEDAEPEPEDDNKRVPVPHNGAAHARGIGSRRRDPSKMSDEDFNKYIESHRY